MIIVIVMVVIFVLVINKLLQVIIKLLVYRASNYIPYLYCQSMLMSEVSTALLCIRCLLNLLRVKPWWFETTGIIAPVILVIILNEVDTDQKNILKHLHCKQTISYPNG